MTYGVNAIRGTLLGIQCSHDPVRSCSANCIYHCYAGDSYTFNAT
jgi:hypothetical protein